MGEDRKRAFIRPPADWNELTDAEKKRWAASLLDHIKVETAAATPDEPEAGRARPATESLPAEATS